MARWLAGGLLVGAMAGFGGTPRLVPEVVVAVFAEGDGVLPVEARYIARTTVSSMFEEIGVRIRWESSAARPAAGGTIALTLVFTDGSAPGAHGAPRACSSPSAFACAWPFSRAAAPAVLVMHERVRAASRRPRLFPRLLAHVIAHEITHVLQLRDVHSATGVMKEQWTTTDFAGMETSRLGFDAQDVEFLRDGVEHRSRGSTPVVR